ncbi:Aste57867_19077 [Aphanomyces stellatus]|uniref:Mitochondrial import inner membrane translocase subunit n=1 Tax=Aphanomyces stellatus TaxID=120398 RepID=A0A485LC04_9STRA|nr:hypothetical protein As57867_019013 [Aphanomyces stellatus]VFT95802.1 Aste57867_19077 [Aphanomyces stellatus]
MSWFGLGGGAKKEDEPLPTSSSFSETSFPSADDSLSSSSTYAPAITSSGGTSVNDIIMEEQQKVLVQQAVAKITAIAWDKCSGSKPDSSLSSSEVACIQNVTLSYLDSTMFIARRIAGGR